MPYTSRFLAIMFSFVASTAWASATPTVQSEQLAANERVADALRFWTEVRFFGISPGAADARWEQALMAEVPALLSSSNDAELKAAAEQMLAMIESTPQTSSVSIISSVPPLASEHGHVVLGCATLGSEIANDKFSPASFARFSAKASEGLIYDCRHFGDAESVERANAAYGFDQFTTGVWAALLQKPASLGVNRMRFWDGYPTERGTTSGGYASGTIDVSQGFLLPRTGEKLIERGPAVLVADSSTPDLGRMAAMFRAAYPQGRLLVIGGANPSAERRFSSKHLEMRYLASEMRAADGSSGPRPEICVPVEQDNASVLRLAASMLQSQGSLSCSAASTPINIIDTSTAAGLVAPDSVPSQGERLLALAKLWGTIRYFHPYEPLNDLDWDNQLALFVPRFANATTRAEYEKAVLELIAHIDDSHVWMSGGKANRISGSYTVPIYRRWLANQLVVDQLYDDSLASKITPGDVITHVDGVPIGKLEALWSELIPASSLQSRNDLVHRVIMNGAQDSPIRLTLQRGSRAFEVTATRSWRGVNANEAPERKDPVWRRVGSDIGYIDLTRLTNPDTDKAIDELLNTRTLILDMRGYPKGTAWSLAPRLVKDGRDEAVNAIFRRPTYVGPSAPQVSSTMFEQRLPKGNGKLRYKGNVIVLIDERAISQSEHSILMFMAATPLITIGTPTAGANGDVTVVTLPGSLGVSFSGHDVRWADGRQLQRIGIEPDIHIEPTPIGIAAGRDEVLERAISEAGRRR